MLNSDEEIKKEIGQMQEIKNSVIMACEGGAIELLEVLIEGGGDVNTADNDGFTILMIAAQKGYIDIVKFLIKHGADLTKQDNNGKTALDIALEENQEEIASILKKRM